MGNIKRVRQEFERLGIDGLLITDELNRRYMTGFTGTAGVALITKDEALFLTDFRYDKQAHEQVANYDVIIHKSSAGLMGSILDTAKKLNIKNLGFEASDVNYDFYSKLKDKSRLNLVPTTKVIETFRLIKTEKEVENIRQAAKISDAAYIHIQGFIRPGVTELEVSHELERFMKKQGADGGSFTFIVASGHRGALPHGVASEKVIEKGEMVKLDFGALYKGYCSDMTRTLSVGEPNPKLKDIYDIVNGALQHTLDTIKAGMTANEIDSIARDYITEKGYGEYFGHGLGHGIGLNIHEDPFFSQNGTDKLQPGMVVTIEPGIYIPELGGVRIEDDILIKEDGIEILTHSSKELIIL